ncbi:Uncharacterised protein [Pseudomonas aeruginosa]|nr:Uncharacterised protein [Pseudomonas aeruginosa]
MLQATLGQPLAEGTEVHFLGVIGAERGHRRLAGAAQRLRPASPVGAGAQVRLQGLEAAVVQQGLAGFAAEFGEVVAQGTGALGEVAVELAQQAHAQVRRRCPVDQLQALQAGHLRGQAGATDRLFHRRRAENGRRRGVQDIEEQPAGRRVGAVGMSVGLGQGVQRADRQRVGAMPRGAAQQVLEGGAVAQAAVAGAAQGIDLGGQTPATRATRGEAGQGRAARRRHRHRPFPLLQRQLRIAAAGLRRQAAFGVQAQGDPRAVLVDQLARGAGGAERLLQRLAAFADQQSEVGAVLAQPGQRGQALFDLLRTLRRIAECFQQAALDLRVDPLRPSVGVLPVELQAHGGGQFGQACVTHGRAPG